MSLTCAQGNGSLWSAQPHAASAGSAAKVTRSALQNAGSIAALVLTTESAVVEKPEEDEAAAGGDGHGHMH